MTDSNQFAPDLTAHAPGAPATAPPGTPASLPPLLSPGVTVVAPASAGPRSDQNLRFMLVVVIGVLVLFVAFGLLVLFSPSDTSIAALAVIATPIASMVAAYYGITLSVQQVRNEKADKDRAIERMVEAEVASKEADVWAAQMESALRVAKVKLDAAGVDSLDVMRAAGVGDDFF
ncbi:hypothetical protein [Luethyella okanaganae]|uniref:Uncharacterized protein n=1 Tax=Luethyella okanaganae TaxID=69372 RepID=A0ABW1VGD5_9MICO